MVWDKEGLDKRIYSLMLVVYFRRKRELISVGKVVRVGIK